MQFLWIFNESQKFSLLIDKSRPTDIIMEAKAQKFSQHFYKSYQTAKLFFRLTFVYGMWLAESIQLIINLHNSYS